MNIINIKELQDTSLKVRENIIKMASGGGCFLGASLSCVEIIVYLYKNYLNSINLSSDNPHRDYFFLSKGHDVPALYSTFAELGSLDKNRLKNHLKTFDSIYWHPNMKIKGVEFHSGSLGHLLSVALGVAYDCKLNNSHNKIVVLMGDGELNEGSVWEAMLTASALKLNNLSIVVDRNCYQANIKTEDLIPLEPLDEKFTSFGWVSHRCNGHDFNDIHRAFTNLQIKDKPSVLIAETVRGKGLPSIENRADRWFCNFNDHEIESLLHELHNRTASSELVSETLTVR
jgi:transketolase